MSPRELCDWFWVAYVDAHDWVVEPNVLAMGSFATGELCTTKPYVSGAAYIDRMSDFCRGCRFSSKKDCPITAMYWDFLARNEKTLAGNPRVAMPLRSLQRRSAARRAHDRRVYDQVRATLDAGEVLDPATLRRSVGR